MQQIPSATSDTSPYQLIAARTLFSVRPTEPPSSPPPTSPLPPLPEIAAYRPSRTSSTTNSTRSGRPSRPPRPTTSLPNLKPRTIRSPEPLIRQQCLATTHRPFSPTTLERVMPIDVTPKHSSSTPWKRNSIRLLSPETTPSFSDDVLAALPKLLQRSPAEYRDLKVDQRLYSPTNETGERIRAWQVYHRSSSRSPNKQKLSNSQTRKPIARSPLFIPRSPSEGQWNTSAESVHSGKVPPALKSSLFPPRRSSRKAPAPLRSLTELNPSSSPSSHKRSKAVTGFVFDFARQGYIRCNPASPSNDNLTSLPRLPSTPTLNAADLRKQKSPNVGHSLHRLHSPIDLCPVTAQSKSSEEEEEVAFSSVPYSNTLDRAGLQPRTDQHRPVLSEAPSSRGSRSQSHSHQCSEDCIDMGEEGVQHVLTVEEKKEIRTKRMLWALATVVLLLIATGGILAGVIWKLKNMN